MAALEELEREYEKAKRDPKFQRQLGSCCGHTPDGPRRLRLRSGLRRSWRAKIYLKREDLLHTGAHKINNCLGQVC